MVIDCSSAIINTGSGFITTLLISFHTELVCVYLCYICVLQISSHLKPNIEERQVLLYFFNVIHLYTFTMYIFKYQLSHVQDITSHIQSRYKTRMTPSKIHPLKPRISTVSSLQKYYTYCYLKPQS